MTYQAWRKKSIREALDLQLKEIVQRYKPGERTVCLLPGGMGSQLEISKRKYSAGNPIPSLPESTIWMDVGITADDAFRLEIKDDHDFKKRAVSPFGPVRFLPLLEPYIFLKNFINDDKGWNFVSFGFDWRRSLTESAHMLHYFLGEFRDRVKAKWGEDPLPTTNFVCHSMGGLVAMRFVHLLVDELGVSPAGTKKWFDKLITIATPFYGTATHMARYYEGISLLKPFYTQVDMTRIVGSLPGPYTLLFMSEQVYDAHATAFANDTYALDEYPMRNLTANGGRADPFDPAFHERYALSVSAGHLRRAKNEMALLTGKVSHSIAKRLFNIRSGEGKTAVKQRWLMPATIPFDPAVEHKAPIKRIGRKGPGDGTVPAWSAKLAWLDSANVYNTKWADDHQGLPDHRETHLVVGRIIEQGTVPARIKRRPQIENRFGRPASRRRVEEFFIDIAGGGADRHDQRFRDPAIWRRVLRDAPFS